MNQSINIGTTERNHKQKKGKMNREETREKRKGGERRECREK